MGLESFEQLDVWRQAHILVLDVYRLSRRFPDEERYGLTSQMRRAAVSIPANIAEGFKRRGGKDKSRFYNMAQGSLEELRYYFILCRDLGYISIEDDILDRYGTIGRMLHGLIRSLSG